MKKIPHVSHCLFQVPWCIIFHYGLNVKHIDISSHLRLTVQPLFLSLPELLHFQAQVQLCV